MFFVVISFALFVLQMEVCDVMGSVFFHTFFSVFFRDPGLLLDTACFTGFEVSVHGPNVVEGRDLKADLIGACLVIGG